MTQILRRSIDELLLVVILGMSAVATLAVVIDRGWAGSREDAARQFQQLLGGLGLGCQTDLAHSARQFDPRLTDDDDGPLDVILGSQVSNPWHSISLFPEDGLPRPSSHKSDDVHSP